MIGTTEASADVLVVGGGVLGTVTAFRLALGGAGRVILCDDVRRGSATAKSVAVLSSFYPDADEAALALGGIRELERFAHTSGRDIGLRRTGVLRLISPGRAEAVAGELERHRHAGGDARLCRVGELADALPGWRTDDIETAVIEPGGGYADPVLTLAAYRDAARAAGVIIAPVAVHGVRTRAGRVAGVMTGDGPLHAPRVVIAAGAWSAALLADVEIDLGLSVRQVQVATFRTSGTPPLEHVVLDSAHGAWFRPDPGGVLAGLEMAVAASVSDGPADETVGQWYVEMCRERLAARLPDSTDAVMRGGWSGLIAMSRDHLPVLDRGGDIDGLFCLTGDSGSSFKTAALLGARMAEWVIADGSPPPDVAHLGAGRPMRAPDLSVIASYNRFGTSVRLAREARRARRPGCC